MQFTDLITSATQQRFDRLARWTTGAMAFAMLTVGQADARGFLPPINELGHQKVRVVTVDGQELYGEIPRQYDRFRGIGNITLQDEFGNRQKLRADQLRQVIVPVTPGHQMIMFSESITTVEKAIKADYELMRNVQAIVFDSIRWPDNDRYLLLPRVNPGFDRNIQVYGLANAHEGTSRFDGIPFFGDEEKSYLAVKDDGEPMRIKKKRYRQDFERLFGDCDDFTNSVSKKQRKFKNFADHVYEYQQVCR